MLYEAKVLRRTGVVLLLVSVLLIGVGVLMANGEDVDLTEGKSEEVKAEEGNNEEGTGRLWKVGLAFGAALAVGLTAFATAYAQARIGAAGMGALAEKPEMTGSVIIGIAIPETMVILGFVTATIIVLMLGK